MVEIVRTKSTNIDFRVLVTILDGAANVDYVNIRAVFSSFNSIEFTDTAVVAYVNNLPVGCGCFIKIDEENVEFKKCAYKVRIQTERNKRADSGRIDKMG